VRAVQMRDYATDRHLTLDDEPYGGGAGMLIRPEPVLRAIRDLRRPDSLVLMLAADGTPFRQEVAQRLSGERHLILLCGHYEGFDARIRHFVDGAISLGDFILTGGEPAAWAVVDAVARLVPGVIQERSLCEESFSDGLLEAPQYTRPPAFRGLEVPGVLRSGNHGAIARHRHLAATERTGRLRPELAEGTGDDRK
ncbi:tRNA (guanine-N1-)-methyltransferase, bacteria, partial [mine drainage metagenome]